MSVKEVPTILKKIAWSKKRAVWCENNDEVKWLNEIEAKVNTYNKLGQRDTDKLQVLYRDGLDDGLKVTYDTPVTIHDNVVANTVIKTQRKKRRNPNAKLPNREGIIL